MGRLSRRTFSTNHLVYRRCETARNPDHGKFLSGNDKTFPKILPNYDQLFSQLESSIRTNHAGLLAMLASEYIYPKLVDTKTKHTKNYDATCDGTQNNTYDYDIHYAATLLEVIIEKGDFARLQQLARESKNGSYDVLMSSFHGQDLREVNFSGLDLSDADFSKANLEKANFSSAIVNNANFQCTSRSRF